MLMLVTLHDLLSENHLNPLENRENTKKVRGENKNEIKVNPFLLYFPFSFKILGLLPINFGLVKILLYMFIMFEIIVHDYGCFFKINFFSLSCYLWSTFLQIGHSFEAQCFQMVKSCLFLHHSKY